VLSGYKHLFLLAFSRSSAAALRVLEVYGRARMVPDNAPTIENVLLKQIHELGDN
jgi:hypothetical protein